MIRLDIGKKTDIYVVLFFVLFVQFVLLLQGFNLCDDGFVLTFYQQFFNDPSSVEYSFVYWLSGLVGGIWYELNPKGGIFWFKILTIIVNTYIFYLSYLVFRKFIPQRLVLLGLLFSLFINDFGFLVFYHNNLTALLTVLSAWFLIEGLSQNKLLFILLSGLIIGVNIFTRLPNVTMLVFILGIPIYHIYSDKVYQKSFHHMLYYVFGVVLGVTLVIIALMFLGQFSIMENALRSLFGLGVSKDSSHGFGALIRTYIFSFLHLLDVAGQFLLIFFSFLFISGYQRLNKWIRKVLIYGCFIYTFLWFKNSGVYSVYAMSYLGALYVFLSSKENNERRVLALLGLLMLTFLPFGSDGAIYNTGYISMWLSLPFFFFLVSKMTDVKFDFKFEGAKNNLTLLNKNFKYFIVFLIIAFFLSKSINIFNEAYFDKGSRLEKTAVINDDLAKYNYTTQERAKIINDLLFELNKYVEPNDYLLAYDNIPMVHYLTQTKPYMYNSWVWTYDGDTFEEKIKKAECEISVLPTVVQQKFNTIGEFTNPVSNYMAEDGENSFLYNKKRTVQMNAFLKRNRYEVVWSNEYFNILKSKKR